MLLKTYEIDGVEYEFNFERFNTLVLGRKREDLAMGKEAVRRQFADEVGYPDSTIKDWLRGTHSPKDIDAVNDLEDALCLNRHDLLIRRRTKEVAMFDPQQINAFNTVRKKILDLLEVAEESDFFCWDRYHLNQSCNSIIRSFVPHGMDEISGPELFRLLKSRCLRELRYQSPILTREMKDMLLNVIEGDVQRIVMRDGETCWYGDPSLFLRSSFVDSGVPCEMAVACANARTALEQATGHFVH